MIIIGAGGFGREVLAAALENPAYGVEWTIGGFLDDAQDAETHLREKGIDIPVVGPVMGHQPSDQYVYICAIGSPRRKLEICEHLLAKGARFINLIHPTAQIGPRCKIGIGNILMYQAGLTADSILGNFVSLNRFVSIGHDAIVGDGCTLSSYCDVTGHARLGRGVFMGSHASILPSAVVEDFSTVGAGSVVVRRVGAGKTVLGVPAKVLDLPR
ncbi:MAG: NeuD/PglB/VioB family sugar acetyltransferase [Firmicutes bacterium]|nr:NeuD/PglB/VioB family sugar acetyltransferase [Bacillota bacterium]